VGQPTINPTRTRLTRGLSEPGWVQPTFEKVEFFSTQPGSNPWWVGLAHGLKPILTSLIIWNYMSTSGHPPQRRWSSSRQGLNCWSYENMYQRATSCLSGAERTICWLFKLWCWRYVYMCNTNNVGYVSNNVGQPASSNDY